MSPATDSFLKGVAGLKTAADRLSSPPLDLGPVHSPDYLQLNGLHVVAFAMIEEYVRSRSYEVFTALGTSSITFHQFSPSLKKQLLLETIRGLENFVSRKDQSDKVAAIQDEVLFLQTTIDQTAPFAPSAYFFGRSKSNISFAQITALLESMAIPVAESLENVQNKINAGHLGRIDGIFERLSTNRHMAAHSFNSDFKLVEFISDVSFSIRIFAFCFDTVLSQCAYQLRKSLGAMAPFLEFDPESICYRSIRYDSLNGEFHVAREEPKGHIFPQSAIREHRLGAELRRITASKHDKDETVFVIGKDGALQQWLQPI